MSTIAEEITALNTNLAAAKAAVTTAGGTVGDTGLAGLASEIATIPGGGGGGVVEKDINFYDYNGTLVESWTLAELANKTALPANPTHAGLTAQGWNWTLAELKTENSKMNVGQVYETTDGKTHLFVEVDADHLSPMLGFGLNGTATVDWGDGSPTETATGSSEDTGVSLPHTYSQAGSYEVTIDVAEGSTAQIRGYSSTVGYLWRLPVWSQTVTEEMLLYASQLKGLWLGRRMYLGPNGSLTSHCINELVLSDYYPGHIIPSYFMYNNSIKTGAVIIPRKFTVIYSNFLSKCKDFNGVISLPPTITLIDSDFLSKCTKFNTTLTIPTSVSTINSSFMSDCQSFSKPLILPSSVSTLGDAFLSNCYSFRELKVDATATVSSNDYTLSCDSLFSSTFDDGVTITGNSASTWLSTFPVLISNRYRRTVSG